MDLSTSTPRGETERVVMRKTFLGDTDERREGCGGCRADLRGR